MDLPIDAYDSDGNPRTKAAESFSDEGSTEVSQTQEKEVVEEKREEDEQRVPYSRFDKMRREKEDAIREAEEARRLVSEISRERSERREEEPSPYEEEIRQSIKKLYGDTPVAKEITELQIRHQRMAEERAEQRALEALDRRQRQESESINHNENILENRLEDLSSALGRDLTEKEELEVLSIVDEFTPTGEDGKYMGEILPLDKAYEIFELRQSGKTQNTRRSRNVATEAASARSSGDPSSDQVEENKSFNPRNWKSLYDRIGK